MTSVINFGKYRGKSVEELLQADQQYLIWLAQGHKNDYLSKDSQLKIKYIVRACRVRFGKHRGLTYAELYDCHPNYWKWLIDNPGNEWLRSLFS